MWHGNNVNCALLNLWPHPKAAKGTLEHPFSQVSATNAHYCITIKRTLHCSAGSLIHLLLLLAFPISLGTSCCFQRFILCRTEGCLTASETPGSSYFFFFFCLSLLWVEPGSQKWKIIPAHSVSWTIESCFLFLPVWKLRHWSRSPGVFTHLARVESRGGAMAHKHRPHILTYWKKTPPINLL